MNKVYYRNYGILFFFFSFLFSMFAFNVVIEKIAAWNLFLAAVFFFTAFIQYRLALLMCRKYNETNLK